MKLALELLSLERVHGGQEVESRPEMEKSPWYWQGPGGTAATVPCQVHLPSTTSCQSIQLQNLKRIYRSKIIPYIKKITLSSNLARCRARRAIAGTALER